MKNIYKFASLNRYGMKERVKIFSYIVLFANIILFAHSFIPHEHNSSIDPHEIAIACSCSSCMSAEISSPESNEGSCGCCSGGSKGCFISGGYIGHYAEDISDISPLYCIDLIAINIFPVESQEETNYTDFTSPILDGLIQGGMGMRAPPVLFS